MFVRKGPRSAIQSSVILAATLGLVSFVPTRSSPGPAEYSTTPPEDALRALLDAYIKRDPQAVLAYAHPVVRKNPDRMARWEISIRSRMRDDSHVIRVHEIRLERLEARGADQVATLHAVIETTPRFCHSQAVGNNLCAFSWSLIQINKQGLWYHFGGGF